jgi:[acyl-carrier-protein] S-malonyltransferase
MKPAGDRLQPELRAVPSRDPGVPVIANVDARPRTTAASAIDALIAQVASPVRWEDTVRFLTSAGVTTCVEVGPGTVLSGLVRKIRKDVEVFNVQAPEDLGALPLHA